MKRILVNEERQLREVLDYAGKAPDWYMDTESGWNPSAGWTEGAGLNWYLDPQWCFVCGISFSPYDDEGFYIPFGHYTNDKQLPKDMVVEAIKPYLETIPCSAHNQKFDYKACRSLGIHLHLDHDSMLLVFCAGVGYEEFNEDVMVEREFHHKKVGFADLFAPKTPKHKRNFALVPTDVASDYSCDDVIWGRKLKSRYVPLVADQPTSRGIGFIYKLEKQLLPVIVEIEDEGMLVDLEYFRSEHVKLKQAASQVEQIIYDQVTEMVRLKAEREDREAPLGRMEFKLNSTKDLPHILFEVLGLPVLETSDKTGKPSTNAIVMERLAKKYPVCSNILAWREIQKAADAYEEDGLERYIAADGRIHTNYRQTGATSGRFASSDPNTQNIAKPHEWKILDLSGNVILEISTNVRDGFIVAPDEYELECDFSMIEYRIFAQLSGEQSVLQALRNGEDVHIQTASDIFEKPEIDITEEERQDGKTMNYFAIFGGGPRSYAARTNSTEDQGRTRLERYFAKRPMFKVWARRVSQAAKRAPLHQVETYFGRKQVVPEYSITGSQAASKADRASVNRVVQGTAADYQKMAIGRVAKALKRLWPGGEAKIFRQTHDSINVKVKRHINPKEVKEAVVEAMEIPIPGWERIPADAKVGLSWGDLVKWEKWEAMLEESMGDYEKVFAEWDERRKNRSMATGGVVTVSPIITPTPDLIIPKKQLPKTIRLHVESMTMEQASSLREFLQAFPGENLFVLDIGSIPGAADRGGVLGQEIRLTKYPSKLDEMTCRDFVNSLFPGVRIEVLDAQIKLDVLLEGITI